MAELPSEIQSFLSANGWADALVSPVAGDLSQRRYFRLRLRGKTAVLMDSSKDPQSTMRFCVVTEWLRNSGLSAPQVHAKDTRQGLLLIEDFGTQVVSSLLSSRSDFSDFYFDAVLDLLLTIRHQSAPDLDQPNAHELAQWTTVTDTAYPGVNIEALKAFRHVLETELSPFLQNCTVSLRDFHADNLMWLPDRHGILRFGLLDYQDAFLTHPVYDLVSTLTDARIEVPRNIREAGLSTYASRAQDDPDELRAAFALFSAQRNMRILGMFTAAAQSGKRHHLPKLTRVHRYFAEAMEHTIFDEVRHDVLSGLPDPAETAKVLAA